MKSEGKVISVELNKIEASCQSESGFSGGGMFAVEEGEWRLVGVLSMTRFGIANESGTGDSKIQPLGSESGF